MDRNKYNHFLAKFIKNFKNDGQEWAITLGQTTYYSCPKEKVNEKWRKHEDAHKEQWKRLGKFKFIILYLFYNFKYGYFNNPFEKEAREKSNL